MADGTIIFETNVDDKELHKDLNKVRGRINTLQSELDRLGAKKLPLEDRLKELATQLDAEKKILYDMRNAPKGTYEKTDISEQAERVRMMQTEYNKAARELEKLNEKAADTADRLSDAKTEAAELAQELAGRQKGRGLRDTMEGAAAAAESFDKRIKRLVKNALVFSAVSRGLSVFKDYLKSVILVNDDARQSIAQLKGALLTLAQPIVSVIVPAFTALVNIITAVVTRISQLIALITGKSVKSTSEAAQALKKETDALEGTGSAAKEAAGELASFDEINQLSGDSDSGSSGAGGGASGLDNIEPDFSYLDDMADRLKTIADAVLLIGTGLGLWKIADSLPGALGTIATKLAGIAISAGGALIAWDGLSDAWENGVGIGNLLESLAGLAIMTAGLALAFGKVGAGIGLAVSAAVLMVTAFKDMCENGLTLENVLMMLSGVLAAGLGIGLLTGSWIPALIAGVTAAILVITAAFGDGEAMVEALEQIIQGFKDFFSAVFIGDMEAAGEALSNIWDGIKKAASIMWEVIKTAGKAFGSWFVDWANEAYGSLIQKLTAWGDNIRAKLAAWGGNIKTTLATWGNNVKEWFSNLVTGIANLGLTKIETFINRVISGLNWMIRKINSISFSVPSWVPGVGGKSVGFNLKELSGVTLPRLATGAVIPPNREFLAVLGDQKEGTNIETPLSTMLDAFRQALAESGGGTTTVVLQLDGKEIARNQVKHINNMTRAAGKPVLLY